MYAYSPATPLHTYQTIWRHIAENRNLNIYRCDNLNLKSIKTAQTCILSSHLKTKADVYCQDGKCNLVMEFAASLLQQNHV